MSVMSWSCLGHVLVMSWSLVSQPLANGTERAGRPAGRPVVRPQDCCDRVDVPDFPVTEPLGETGKTGRSRRPCRLRGVVWGRLRERCGVFGWPSYFLLK